MFLTVPFQGLKVATFQKMYGRNLSKRLMANSQDSIDSRSSITKDHPQPPQVQRLGREKYFYLHGDILIKVQD